MSILTEAYTEAEILQLFPVGSNVSVLFFDSSANGYKYYNGNNQTFSTLSTGVTPETVQDIIGSFIQGDSDVVTDYDDPNNVLNLSLSDTGVSAGQYGGGNGIPLITVDEKGRVVAISNGPSLVLGDNHYERSSQPATPPSNGTATLQDAYSFTTPTLDAGKYKVEFEWFVEPSSTSNNSIFRPLIDGQRFETSDGDLIDDIAFEGKDVGSDVRRPLRFKGFVTLANPASRTLALQHAAQAAAGTVVTHYCSVEMYRISP